MNDKNKIPSKIDVLNWFTDEKDLPTTYTEDFFLVKVVDLKTSEEFHTIATFHYWFPENPRKKETIDYDEWRFMDGSRCFARESEDNIYKVVGWGKLKLDI